MSVADRSMGLGLQALRKIASFELIDRVGLRGFAENATYQVTKNGFKVSKAQIRMPNGPIKIVSDSTVSVALHTDVVVDITVSVYGETA